MKYVIFEKKFNDIPEQDLPVGNILICFDSLERLRKNTWCVVKINTDDRYIPLGLFWEKIDAIRFAEKTCAVYEALKKEKLSK